MCLDKIDNDANVRLVEDARNERRKFNRDCISEHFMAYFIFFITFVFFSFATRTEETTRIDYVG